MARNNKLANGSDFERTEKRDGFEIKAGFELKLGHRGLALLAGGLAAVLWAVAHAWGLR